MKFIKISFSYCLTTGLLILALFFIQNEAVGQSGKQLYLRKQQAVSEIFGGAKIIKQQTWKSYLDANKDQIEVFNKLNISTGTVYRINKPDLPDNGVINVLFSEKRIVFLDVDQNIKDYFTDKYFDIQITETHYKFVFFYIGPLCTPLGDCLWLYRPVNKEANCRLCGGIEKNPKLPNYHRVLAQ